MTTISAQTVLRSRNASRPDKVLSTLLLRYPRWIHAEQRTHRIIPLAEEEDFFWAESTPSLMADPNLSRNAASSRAIPVNRLIEDIKADPAVPLFWGKNVAGMQAFEELTGEELRRAKSTYNFAMAGALKAAEEISKLGLTEDGKVIGVHKQIANRLIEPYSHITVLVSATEWSNFLELRDHGDAEPHIAMLAREIRKCLDDESTIQTLQPGEWHLPFMTREKSAEIYQHRIHGGDYMRALLKYSTACCASTSYKTVEGFDMTIDRAVAIHDKLVGSKPIHASPAEHVAMVDEWNPVQKRDRRPVGWQHPREHANFEGFIQYRHELTV